jgi:hypothetical protein
MKKYILSGVALLCTLLSIAQAPEDVLRYSYFPRQGTARNMAIGGAMASLGGDITAVYVNPAGLGFFKTGEVVLSPGFNLYRNKANFRGTDTSTRKNAFNLGMNGLVVGFNTPGSKWTNQAFSIAINQSANFNNTIHYKGTNSLSSYSQVFADDFAASGLTIDQALNNTSYAFGTGLALYSYLVDTFRNAAGNLVVKSQPEFLLEKGIALKQEKTIATSGGIYEIALGYAANMDDKVYLGGSLGIPIVDYERKTTYRESDPSGITNNNFDYFQLNDTFSTKGFGLNLKLGMIYKPKEFIRLGLAVHTPTYYSLTDRQNSGLTANTEGYADTRNAYSKLLTNGEQGRNLYTSTTPWRIMASGSYVFRETNDTRRQRAFITADIEYVGYSGARFRHDEESPTDDDVQYYKRLKGVIKDYYKGAFNYKLGGELKFNTIMFRLGGAYYGNPYRQKELSSNIIQASGGLGYRNHGMFIDLTYAHNFIKDVNFPYRLEGTNTFAEQTNTAGNVMVTVGFKF